MADPGFHPIVAQHAQLTRLYETIRKLMDAAYKSSDQDFKLSLASLELRAQSSRQELEKRLGPRN